MVAKTLPLNQTYSRPICYAYSQHLIAELPSKWKSARDEAIKEFKNTIPKIKELVKEKIGNLYPKGDLETLKKYELTNQESCFWFTDRDEKDDRGRTKKTDRSIYANFDCEGYGSRYNYGSSNSSEIGNLSISDTIAIYFDDMVKDGIDVMKYLFLSDWGKDNNGQSFDYNGKKINRWTKEYKELEESIQAYSKKFFEENDMSMEFTMPNSNYSCYQRAHLVSEEQYQVLYSWTDAIERIQLKWHKQKDEMKAMFKAYAELIRTSKNLEQLVKKDSAFESCRSKIMGTGTAVALSSINSSLIDECIARRNIANTTIGIVLPKESVGV